MSHNTWIHKLARVTIVRPLVGTSVTPNHLTTVRIILGMSAACLLAFGEYTYNIIGAALFLFSMLFDRADGDYARFTGQTSPSGHKYDLISDAICNGSIFVGLGIGQRHGEFGTDAILMGGLAGVAVVVILFLVIRIEHLQGPRAAEIGNRLGFDADDAMALAPVAIIVGWSDRLLVAAAIGAPLFAIFFAFLFSAKLRSGGKDTDS